MTATARSAATRSPLSRTLGPIALAGGVVAAVGVATFDGGDDGVVLCPLRRCTGAYCPGCGGTRAAASLVRGDVAGAWQRHPFVVLLAVQLMVLVAVAADGRGRAWVRRHAVVLTVVNALGMLVLWAVRLARGDIPGFL